MTDRRDQLADALRAMTGTDIDHVDGRPFDFPLVLYPGNVADALLPVVDRLIREAQADALDNAAKDCSWGYKEWLRERAAAYRSQP